MSMVSDILNKKGSSVWTVSPQDTVKKTLIFMAEKNIGAVIVMETDHIAGIFSERDFARHCAKSTVRPEDVTIKEIMTKNVLIVNPSQSTEECMSLMTTKRLRHLPVVENNKLIGMVSIGDVVNRIIEDQKFSLNQLERYVAGEA